MENEQIKTEYSGQPMLDSTIIDRISRYLDPDEKIKACSKPLDEAMATQRFRNAFKKKCESRIQKIDRRGSYYRKYKKPEIRKLRKRLAHALRARAGHSVPEGSAVLQSRIAQLNFHFRKMSITVRPITEREGKDAAGADGSGLGEGAGNLGEQGKPEY